jgi:hypothetical protein
MNLAVVSRLYVTRIHRTLIGRHLEASSHVRGRHEHEYPRCAGRPAGQADRRLHSPLHPHGAMGPPDVWAGLGAWLRQWRASVGWRDLYGVEVAGRPRARRAPQHRRGALGPLGQGGGRPAGGRRRCDVPVPLDAAVRTRGPPTVTSRDGLGGSERRELGDRPQRRAGVRLRESAHGWRQSAGVGSFCDVSAPGSRGYAGPFHAERWAAGMAVPGYAIDDETAIKVVDDTVEVVSEGHWRLFTSNS